MSGVVAVSALSSLMTWVSNAAGENCNTEVQLHTLESQPFESRRGSCVICEGVITVFRRRAWQPKSEALNIVTTFENPHICRLTRLEVI